jgi:hypothetical protein
MTRITGSATSISWIDPASPAGARVPDTPPPASITEGFATGSTGFRFSNYLNAWVDTEDSVHLTGADFAANAGLYRGPSFAGVPSYPYPVQRNRSPFNEGGVEGMEFEQTVGARTISPGVIGGGVGGLAGIGAGAFAGFKLGGLSGSPLGPLGAGGGALVGGLLGGAAGYFIGTGVARTFTNFPPIWTRIKLRIKANGEKSHQLVEHSHFPANNFYADLSQVRTYGALAPEEARWGSLGWGGGNPWGIPRPTVTP